MLFALTLYLCKTRQQSIYANRDRSLDLIHHPVHRDATTSDMMLRNGKNIYYAN